MDVRQSGVPPLLVDQGRIGPRFVLVLSVLSLSLAFELFDFFIVGFLVSAIAPAWKLTFGQSGLMLLIASVGAMIGAALGGVCADRFGRKRVLMLGATGYPLAAAAIGFVATGDWITFAILRFLVGFAYGFGGVAQFALIVELTPTRLRTILSSASMVPIALGFVLAPSAMSLLYQPLGWRGLAFLCIVPLIFVPIFALLIPESPTWLSSKRRADDAVRATAKLFDQLPSDFAPIVRTPNAADNAIATKGHLLNYKRQLVFCILAFGFHSAAVAGILLWGPLVLAMLLGITPHHAATYFIAVSISGLAGRLCFTFLSQRVGRLTAGQIAGYCAAMLIAIGALFPHLVLGGMPLFVVCLIAAALFFDGGLANLQPHPAEIFPVGVAARGVAVSHMASGFGKVGGPTVLALLAGTGHVVSPAATRSALTPGFLVMAAFLVVSAAAFTFLGTETHRRPVRIR